MTQQELAILLKINADTAQGKAALQEISGVINGLDSDTQAASGRMKTAWNNTDKAVRDFSSSAAVQMGMAGALGAMTAFVAGSVTSLAQFEDIMTDVQKTTGMSAAEIDVLGESLREMSTVALDGLVSADALGEIAAQAGQLGIRGEENIKAFVLAIGEMTVATDLSAEQAATGMADIENAFRNSLEASGQTAEAQTANIGSAFNALSNTTNATVGQILDMTSRMGGAAETIGLTVAETAAIAATVKSLGVEVEVGGTAMSKFFMDMLTNSRDWANALGLDADKVSEAMRTRPVEAIKMVVKGMGDLKDTSGPEALAAALDDLGVKDTRLLGAMLKLSGAYEQLETNTNNSNTAFTEATSQHEEFLTKAESNASQWQGIGEKAKEAMRGFGDELKPATDLLTDWAAGGLDVVLSATRSWRGGMKDEFFDAVVEQAVAGDGVAGMLTKWGQGGYDVIASLGESWGNAISLVFINPSLEQFDEWIGSVSDIFGGVTDILVAPVELAVNTIDSLLGTSIAQMATEMAEGPDSASASFRNLYDELEATARQYGDLVDANEELGSTAMSILDELTAAMDDPTRATDDLAERTRALTDDIRALGVEAYGSSTYPDMTAAILDSREASNVLNEEIRQSREDVAALGTAYEQAQAKVKAKEAAIRSISQEIQSYKSQADSAYSLERDRLEDTTASLERKKAAMQGELASLREYAGTSKSAYDEASRALKAQEQQQEQTTKSLERMSAESQKWAMAYAQHAMDVSYASDKQRKQVDDDLKKMGEAGQKWAMAYAQHAMTISYANTEEVAPSFREMASDALDSFDSLADGIGGLSGGLRSLGDMFGLTSEGGRELKGEFRAQEEAISDLELQRKQLELAMLDASESEKAAIQEQIDGIDTKIKRNKLELDIAKESGEAYKNIDPSPLTQALDGLDKMQQYAQIPGMLKDIGSSFSKIFGEEGLGKLGSSLSGILDSLGPKLSGVLGNVGGAVSGAVGSIGSALGSVGGMVSGAVGSIGSALGSVGGMVSGALGSVGGAVSGALGGIGSALGGLGGAASSLMPALGGVAAALGPLALVGGAAFGVYKLVQAFQDTETAGYKASKSWGDLIGLGAEMRAEFNEMDFSDQFASLGDAGMQAYNVLANSADGGTTAMERFQQAIGEATGNQEKAGQVAIQTMSALEAQGLSIDQIAMKMGEMTAQAMGTSVAEEQLTMVTEMLGNANALNAEQVDALKARYAELTGAEYEAVASTQDTGAATIETTASIDEMGVSLDEVAGKLQGAGEEGEGATTVFDVADAAVNTLSDSTDTFSGSLDQVTGKLSGAGSQGASTTGVFDRADRAVNTLTGDTNVLSGSLNQVTGKLSGAGSQGASTTGVFDQADRAVNTLTGDTNVLSGSLNQVTGKLSGAGSQGASTTNIFDIAGKSAGSLKGQADELSSGFGGTANSLRSVQNSTGAASSAFRSLLSDMNNLPSHKTITVEVRTSGGNGMASGGIVDNAPIIYNELGMEAAKFPGGALALLTQPGPTVGVFPVGTEIIPHTRVPSLLQQYPNMPRMASGGTVTAAMPVSIGQLTIHNHFQQAPDAANIERLTEQMSRKLAEKIRRMM